jgi:hypothetical protein
MTFERCGLLQKHHQNQPFQRRTAAETNIRKQASEEEAVLLTLLWCLVSHTYTYLKPDTETFIPNMTTNENRLEIRRNWDLLMPCTLTFQFRSPATGCIAYLILYLPPLENRFLSRILPLPRS